MTKKTLLLLSISVMLMTVGASCITKTSSSSPVGMYRSADKGDTWKAIPTLPTSKGILSIAGVNIFRIYDDPSDPNAMYIGTRGQGLYYTYDNGDTWRAASAMNGKYIYGLTVDPQDKCNVYVTDGLHIYKTEDCSRTWNLVYTEERPDQRFVSLAMDYSLKDVIYGAEIGGDILKSVDGGRNWAVVKRFGFYLQYLATDPNMPDRIYVASYRKGLYRSDDGANTWQDLNPGLELFSNSTNFSRLIINPAQKDSLFWICKYGILRSDDAGATFTAMKLIPPPGSVNIYGFAINPKNQKEIYFTATILGEENVHVRSTFYKTTDGGNTWVTKKMPTASIPTAIRLSPDKPATVFMGFTSLAKQPQTTF